MEKFQPTLRFPEFEGDYANRKLGDFTIWASGGTPSKQNNDFWNGVIPWISASSMRGLIYTDSELKITEEGLKKGSKIAKKGSLLILVRGSMLFNKIPIGIAGIDVAFNQDLKSISADASSSSEYLLQWFFCKETVLLDMVTGTGIGAGKLDLNDLKSLNVKLPSVEEQTKIATFLSSVDEKLNLLKEKKALLKEYKKGMMQQIFSQQLRFKDEDGKDFAEWEEKTFGEMSTIKRGASPRPITDSKWFDENSKIGWVRISDVTKSKKFLLKTEQYLSSAGVSKSRLVSKGNLIMSICATIGKPIYTSFDVCIHDGFVVFENLKGYREYFYYYLQHIQKTWYNYGQPGTQVNLNSEIVSNEIILFPCLEEQTKIANFLSAIDEKITTVAEVLEATQEYKRGLLQGMFC